MRVCHENIFNQKHLRKLNLKKLMQDLYIKGNYYASIESESNDFEESYHFIKNEYQVQRILHLTIYVELS